MAGAIFRVIDLSPVEDESEAAEAELLTDVELVARYAPKLDTTKASNASLIDEWIKGFVKNEAIQAGFGVRVEKVDSRQVFDQRLENFQNLERETREAKKELVAALRSVLSDITAEDIAEGEVHTITANGKLKVGVVESFIAKSKVPAKDMIEKYGDDFSSEVRDELVKLQKKRSEEAAKRTAGKR
ncbi:hypothetical protein [Microbacterium sp. CIAB417]|uniref:hypothetical protein n=1 Tax=Microbacterium sp. CIAB417 TaxID=2860287 RepID=UPI001FAD1A3C|nr:hypothetical protein [Microbacterium sp. CIAB417]